jgi:hypothetical protein
MAGKGTPIVLWCLLVGIVTSVLSGALVALLGQREPVPIRAFTTHRDAMASYAKAVISGDIPRINGIYGDYPVPEELAHVGVIGVRKSADDTVSLIFGGSLPPDATQSLVYCPRSRNDVRQISPAGGRVLLSARYLDPNWFYCEADD